LLRAVILDFSSVNNVDISSVQNLIDVRNQLDRYATPETVEWHIACINNRWTKRALVSAGFGYPTPPALISKRWKPIFSVAEIGGRNSAAADAERTRNEELQRQRIRNQGDISKAEAIESAIPVSISSGSVNAKELGRTNHPPRVAVVHGLNRPFFHTDLTTALESAISSVERKLEVEQKGGKDITEDP
jgi:sodium-independent sulfate anion transporter 11